jgi:hypothetical protein
MINKIFIKLVILDKTINFMKNIKLVITKIFVKLLNLLNL